VGCCCSTVQRQPTMHSQKDTVRFQDKTMANKLKPLHEQVCKAREAAGWSQYKLAQMIGATPDQISRLESDPALKRARKRRGVYPSIPLLMRVAWALKTTFTVGPCPPDGG
jgi:ribosome-binding protein aMBF1 (putative translation factor)